MLFNISPGYSASIHSTAANGSKVLTVSAFDLDKDKNAELTYEIASESTAVLRTFKIDAASGVITLIRNLTVNGESLIH